MCGNCHYRTTPGLHEERLEHYPYLSVVAVPGDDLFPHTPLTFSLRGNIVVSICDHYNRNYEHAVHAAVMAGKQTFFIKTTETF